MNAWTVAGAVALVGLFAWGLCAAAARGDQATAEALHDGASMRDDIAAQHQPAPDPTPAEVRSLAAYRAVARRASPDDPAAIDAATRRLIAFHDPEGAA